MAGLLSRLDFLFSLYILNLVILFIYFFISADCLYFVLTHHLKNKNKKAARSNQVVLCKDQLVLGLIRKENWY